MKFLTDLNVMRLICLVLFCQNLWTSYHDSHSVAVLHDEGCASSRFRVSLIESEWLGLSVASESIATEDVRAAQAWKNIGEKDRVNYWLSIGKSEKHTAELEKKYSSIIATSYDVKSCGGTYPTPAPLQEVP